jgi:hypothetical protein
VSGQHARNSASSASRWMVCPGSVGSGDPSQAAAQGTFAHDIAAQCLKDQSLTPADFYLKRGKVDGFDVECDQEMVEGILVYMDALDDDLQEGDKLWVEMPLLEQLQTVDRDCGGTADYVRYRPSTRELLVCDFKYGAGTYVEVDDNKQLRIYALGAMLEASRKYGFKVDTVRSMVVQPRYEGANPIRSETFKAVELLDFAADIAEACERTRLPNPPLVAGDHCAPFCPKRRTCPELTKKHHAIIAMTDLAAVPAADIALALADIPLLMARKSAIEAHAYTIATQGVDIPGWKLVWKEGRRKWKRDGDVIEWAQKAAIDPYAPRELLSPAQLEERVKAAAPKGKKKAAIEVLAPFYEKVSSGTALVPVSDSRPAVKRVGEDDFAVVDGAAKPQEQLPVFNLF